MRKKGIGVRRATILRYWYRRVVIAISFATNARTFSDQAKIFRAALSDEKNEILFYTYFFPSPTRNFTDLIMKIIFMALIEALLE